MNDDARFLFCLGGFTGFLFFFLVSFFWHGDALSAFIYGSFGCLFMSICSRFLLGCLLRGISKQNLQDNKNSNTSSGGIPKINKTQQEISASAMNEAASKAKPLSLIHI